MCVFSDGEGQLNERAHCDSIHEASFSVNAKIIYFDLLNFDTFMDLWNDVLANYG